MRTISRFLSLLVVASGLTVLVPAISFAAVFWKADISIPLTQYSRSFNVQYTTLSTNASDAIKVDLYQNGAMIGTQTTTKAYGDSGAFAVTVPTEGTYDYYIVAKNGADTQTTATQHVSVVSRPTVVNTVSSPSSGSSSQNGSGAGANGVFGSAEGTSSLGSSTSTTGTNGQVGANGSSSTNKSNQTLGDSKSSTNNDNKKSDDKKASDDKKNSIITWSIIGVLALALIAYVSRAQIASLLGRNSK